MSSPWRSKKRAKVAAGIWVKLDGSADQIDEPSGTRYQSRNPGDQRCGASTASNVTLSGGGSAKQPPGQAVEADHVGQHAQEVRAGQIAPLGEDRGERRPPPLKAGTLVGHAEAHVAGLGGDPELVEEATEQRIGALVVDEEPGVDVTGQLGQFDLMGMRVAAGALV